MAQENENVGCLPALGGFIYMVFVFPLCNFLLRAWVFTKAWSWFVGPLGVRSIGVAHASGLIMLAGSLVPFRVDKETTKWVLETLGIKRELTFWESLVFATFWGFGSTLLFYACSFLAHSYQ